LIEDSPALAAALGAPAVVAAADTSGMNGTWGGADGGLTAQVIVTGAQVIGFYWRRDYLDVREVVLSPDQRTLTFAFAGGDATLARTGERSARIEVRDRGAVTRLDLKRD
jgi:hypothetical protein